MGAHHTESGFTLIEMIVALVVMTLFLAVFFQLFTAAESQRITVLRRAAANDLALSNVQKISTKSSVSLPACVSGAGSVNSLTDNVNAAGSVVATNDTSDSTNYPSHSWQSAGLGNPESISGTLLPSGTIQKLIVLYPRGCGVGLPAKITSSVIYSNGSETVSHATYVN